MSPVRFSGGHDHVALSLRSYGALRESQNCFYMGFKTLLHKHISRASIALFGTFLCKLNDLSTFVVFGHHIVFRSRFDVHALVKYDRIQFHHEMFEFVFLLIKGDILSVMIVLGTSYHSIPAVHYSCNPGMRIKHSLFLYTYFTCHDIAYLFCLICLAI